MATTARKNSTASETWYAYPCDVDDGYRAWFVCNQLLQRGPHGWELASSEPDDAERYRKIATTPDESAGPGQNELDARLIACAPRMMRLISDLLHANGLTDRHQHKVAMDQVLTDAKRLFWRASGWGEE
jgi:hypothetical protein